MIDFLGLFVNWGYRCIQIDTVTDCTGWAVNYNKPETFDQIEEDCEALNVEFCEQKTCVVESNFAKTIQNLSEGGILPTELEN